MVWPTGYYAASGINWNCLMNQMNVADIFTFVAKNTTHTDGQLKGYPASLITTGQVECDIPDGHATFLVHLVTVVWFALLVIAHLFLSVCLTGLGAIWISNAKYIDYNDDNKKLVYSKNLMLAAMPVLAVAAISEVAQHVLFNWLYLGLIPSTFLATFYGGLALGMSMLALGAWGSPPGPWLYILPMASVLSFGSILHGQTHCNQAAIAASTIAATNTVGTNELSLSTSMLLSDADIAYGKCLSFLPFLPSFITMGISTLFCFTKTNVKGNKNKTIRNKYMAVAFVSLAIGIGLSIAMTATGHQFLHLPTVCGFLGLFYFTLLFIKKIPELNKTGSHTKDNQFNIDETVALNGV